MKYVVSILMIVLAVIYLQFIKGSKEDRQSVSDVNLTHDKSEKKDGR